MRFPKDKLVLFSIRAEFVDFDELINFSKKHRAFKRSYYVTIDYPDSFDVLLVRDGELRKVMRITGKDQSREIGIREVEEKIKHTDSSLVNVAFADDQLLAMMQAGLEAKNVVREVAGSRVPPTSLLRDMASRSFSGILAVTRGSEKSYALMKEGEIALAYMANGGRTTGELVKYLDQNASEVVIKILKEVPEETGFATSAQTELLFTSANRVLDEFSAILGQNIVKKLAQISLKGVAKEHTFFSNLTITEDAKLEGEVQADTESLVKGFASFMNLLSDSLSTISGGRHIAVFRKALQDYRFALNNLKFFDHLKEQIF